MKRNIALVIAVEKYHDSHISDVAFANADAIAFKEALFDIRFAPEDVHLLIDSKSTKTTIESVTRSLLASIGKNDAFFFYFAGHGFADGGRNYIICNDSRAEDLVNTSISVAWLFQLISESKCEHVTVFLDSCDSGMEADPSIRAAISGMTELEFKSFIQTAEHKVVFAACKPGQKSHSSQVLGHGIWTHHLIEALRANAPKAIINSTLVTSSSLQNYLSDEVPRSVRNLLTSTTNQQPWCYGAQSNEFLIADLSEIVKRREQTIEPN